MLNRRIKILQTIEKIDPLFQHRLVLVKSLKSSTQQVLGKQVQHQLQSTHTLLTKKNLNECKFCALILAQISATCQFKVAQILCQNKNTKILIYSHLAVTKPGIVLKYRMTIQLLYIVCRCQSFSCQGRVLELTSAQNKHTNSLTRHC